MKSYGLRKADHTSSNLSKAVFHKFYLVYFWILVPNVVLTSFKIFDICKEPSVIYSQILNQYYIARGPLPLHIFDVFGGSKKKTFFVFSFFCFLRICFHVSFLFLFYFLVYVFFQFFLLRSSFVSKFLSIVLSFDRCLLDTKYYYGKIQLKVH